MPEYNQLFQPSYTELLRRLLNLQDAGATSLAPELVATLVLENDRFEYGYLRGEKYGARFSDQAAVVAALSGVGLGNPVSSGVIAIVDAIWFNEGSTGEVANLDVLSHTNLANNFTVTNRSSINRDRRTPTLRLACQVRGGSATAATIASIIETTVEVGFPEAGRVTTDFRAPPFLLPPGQALLVSNDTLNTLIRVFYRWRERPFLSQEL